MSAMLLVGLVWAAACDSPAASHARPAAEPFAAGPPAGPPPATTVYVHYYLWWTPEHWREKLGPAYPYAAKPPPAAGQVDSDSCSPRTSYLGATIVDVPAQGLYDQDLAETFDSQIELASAAGIRGFLVDWQGTGRPGQSPTSSGANTRLELIAARVRAFNESRHAQFSLGLAFAAYGDYNRPPQKIVEDLTYFERRYGSDAAYSNPFASRPIVMVLSSRRYSIETLAALAPLRPGLYLVGDETSATWQRDEPFLDAGSYYWSSENPWANSGAGKEITRLGSEVHASGKLWFAPFIPGYDKQLVGGTCVPRRGSDTMRKVWETNRPSSPDGWFGISWNEYVENTHLEPSRAYGSTYLTELSQLIAGAG